MKTFVILALAAILLTLTACGSTFQCVSGDPVYNAAEKKLTATCDGKVATTVTWSLPPVFSFKCPAGQKVALGDLDQPVCIAR